MLSGRDSSRTHIAQSVLPPLSCSAVSWPRFHYRIGRFEFSEDCVLLGVRIQFGMARNIHLINFALTLYLYFITLARDLLDPRHGALVPLGQRIPVHSDNVTEEF